MTAKRKRSKRKSSSPAAGARTASERPGRAPPGHRGRRRESQGAGRDGLWLYGVHTALAALANHERRIERLVLTEDAGRALRPRIEKIAAARARDGARPLPTPEIKSRQEIEGMTGKGTVHQGIALLALPLPDVFLEDILDATEDAEAVLVVLDRVTDPQNVGAILRSAAAFGARAVIVPGRGAAPPTGALAKAASGALEFVPLIEVTNLSAALDALKARGFWCAGLDSTASQSLGEADLSGRLALVLGSEGKGLRRLVGERCDLLVRVAITDRVESLNVSAAAAIALYELARGG
ncbi:MAG: 23S rRNA (guanosine(2251)-2'-O)-methyltransferase RlmB [Proteobacteria bacterium]|nr:23S rRNA (guanosine(2251)-2'-O)-methyltransferase RlmB [Pseudomonadota bacterium]MCH8098380.1 23S rRNA (guanosine(2251)-2'-O)-methyltransferase RlmB [Pseudomonadota bacterium]